MSGQRQLADRVLTLELAVNELQKEITKMANELDNLETEVTKTKGVMDSAIVLLEGLSQQLKDALASNDPTRITAIIDELDAKTADLATAVAANTPAEPVTP